MEKRKPWSFCKTPEEKCTMNFCDENGCQNRERNYVEGNTTISDSGLMLPDNFSYYDENGNEVHLVGVVKNWAVVESRLTGKTWIEPIAFLEAIYEDNLKFNKG